MLPDLPRLDFGQARALPPAVRARLAALLEQRASFQKLAADPGRLAAADIAQLGEKLGFSVDLLELCAGEGLQPDPPAYREFLSARGRTLRLPDGAEAALTADLIFSRYLFAFAAVESARADCAALCRSLGQPEAAGPLAKGVIDRLLPPLVRLHRMNRHRESVFAGLGGAERLPELSHLACDAIERLFRVNFASVLAIKTLVTPLNPDKAVFLAQLGRRTQLTAEAAAGFFAGRVPDLQAFCALAARFFHFIAAYALLRCNVYEHDGLLRRTKDYKAAVCESGALAAELQRLARQAPGDGENGRMFGAFYGAFMAAAAEEALRHFACLRDELAGAAPDAGRGVEGIALGHDFVDGLLEQQ